ncbi:hypothetical protein B0H17DRAFT_343517 [Mycena rosella]|uniref:MYND-type domain-containing protein n=1 Tax=Mycena rosella TaxID=1033263 RepID=A0AAD7CQR0_MYCRO|nr:hypothetical protein B0H17DRAFT_343517 [Mycena rosella]
MAHPLVFPGRYFFYPIGNTSAVSLLRDLAPEESANLLLLGCGDPRNILYSISETPQAGLDRPLDFTCCDIDPAILARNVLLFTLLADGLDTCTVWSVFFHFYLDKNALLQLTTQCRKLLDIGESLEEWASSTYAAFIRMGTQYTLTELRRHWTFYIDMHNLPVERKNTIRDAFSAKSRSAADLGIGARSAGPVIDKALKVCAAQFMAYWKTGTTFTKPKETAAATFLNPTFVYSLGGEGCYVHYGTDPVAPFHLAALFGNGGGPVSIADVVGTVKNQFGGWGSAFRAAVSSGGRVPVIRFFASEATALCRALKGFSTSGALNLGIPVAQWKTQLLQLNRAEYGNAPSTFNVIDTSNLSDHIGLLNILIATVPLLRPSASRGSVLYTESLLFHSTDATKEFAAGLHADIHTLGFLLGISPIDYHSGFSSRSNTHELRMYSAGRRNQFHQTTTWKSPASGDMLVFSGRTRPLPPVWDGRQLGTLLYDIYHELFEQEDARHFLRIHQNNLLNAVSASNLIHYMRESFVLFLKLVREHFEIPDHLWTEVMERFIGLKEADQSLQMDSVNYQDLSGHLHLHGVHTVPFLHITQKSGPFAAWDAVPLLVRVILVVPREKFDVLQSLAEKIGTPVLQCDTRGNWSHNQFSGVHAAFGSVIRMGTKARPRVIFKEDTEGWKGSSPIVVSFTMSAGLLTLEPAQNTRICFSIRSTPASVNPVVQRLGIEQSVFSANLMDEDHVYVLPQDPFPTSSKTPLERRPTEDTFEIGNAAAVAVELDEECELVSSLTSVVQVQNMEAKTVFGAGAMPEISQVSPCVMRLVIGKHAQNIVYPIPVIGGQNKLRLARKSSYIEIIVPPSGPFKQGGMKANPFPVIGSGTALHPWNIHRLKLSSLPILSIKTASQKKWLNNHLGSMMSAREYALRKAREDDALMRVKDTLNAIFVESTGSQGGDVKRVFTLVETESNNCDTVLFISDLRFDLPSHTVVCDGYVLPLTREILSKIERPFGKLVQEKVMSNIPVSKVEIGAWKRLLPALVERCRSWKHADRCEYVVQGRVPLSDEMERDPLCGCGKGKDIEGMRKVAQWAKLAPFTVRVALSPLFAVSYLEKVGRDPAAGRCFVCRGKGKPKMMKCTACGRVRYCSTECQRKDWKAHKPKCKQAVVKV